MELDKYISPSREMMDSLPHSSSIIMISLTALISGLLLTPVSRFSPRHHDPILSTATTGYIEEVKDRWTVPGIAITVVTSPNYNKDGGWAEQIVTLGRANAAGDKVDSDVSWPVNQTEERELTTRSVRPCLPWHRTQSYSQRSLWVV